MSTSGKLHFLLKGELRGYVFNPVRSEGLTFSDPNSDLRIVIRSTIESGKMGSGHRDLEFRVTTSGDVPIDHIHFVEALIDRRYLNASGEVKELPYCVGGEEKIDATGLISEGYMPTWEMIPKGLQEFGCDVDRYLKTKFIRFLQLLRWQQKVPGPVDIVREAMNETLVINPGDASTSSLYWKTTHEYYHYTPRPKSEMNKVVLGDSRGLKWPEHVCREFTELWKDQTADEPLAHQLLREAQNIANKNHRSGLMIAYAALEVGLKQHISVIAPSAAWLLMQTQSPPIYKTLRDYIPLIHKGHSDIGHWNSIKNWLKLADKFTTDRNRLAHRGEEIQGKLPEYISLTEDLLYIFDVLEGREWAKSRVSSDLRKKLNWG